MHHRHAGGVIDPDCAAGPCPDAPEHGHGFGQVVVEDPRPDRVSCRIGQRPDDGDGAQRGDVQGQQLALVAQQHGGPLGGDPGDVAVGRIAEYFTGAVLVDVRVVEQAEP